MAAAQAEPLGCLIEPDRVADVGSAALGVIDQMHVERGDIVREGQVLARLSADVERASMGVADARAKAEAEVRGAEAAAELARRKFERARELVKQNFISEQGLDQAEAEARVADERAAQAREARKVAERELQVSAAQLGQRVIRSPFDGIVIERYHTQGERIEREPVAKVVKVDPLRVEVIVPAAQFGSLKVGQYAQVTPQLPQFGVQMGTITLVDRVIDAASNSFRVRLAIPNPAHRVPAGQRCKVDFAINTPPPNAPAMPQRPAPDAPEQQPSAATAVPGRLAKASPGNAAVALLASMQMMEPTSAGRAVPLRRTRVLYALERGTALHLRMSAALSVPTDKVYAIQTSYTINPSLR